MDVVVTTFGAGALFITMQGRGPRSDWPIDILASVAIALSATWWFLAVASAHSLSSTIFTAGGSTVIWMLLVVVGSKKLRGRRQFLLLIPTGTIVWLVLLLFVLDKVGFVFLAKVHEAEVHAKLSAGVLVSSCWTWALFRVQDTLERCIRHGGSVSTVADGGIQV